jgi:hypothetical protein
MMLRAVAQRIPLWPVAAGTAPRWGWLLFLLAAVMSTVSVVLWLNVGRMEKRVDEIERQLGWIHTTNSQTPHRLRAAQLGLGEPMTLKFVVFRPRATFEWWGHRANVTFTITEVRDKALQIRIAGNVARNPFKPVDAILPIEPGVAMSLRPIVDVAGLRDLHVMILTTPYDSSRLSAALIAVGPKAERPTWGVLRKE